MKDLNLKFLTMYRYVNTNDYLATCVPLTYRVICYLNGMQRITTLKFSYLKYKCVYSF